MSRNYSTTRVHGAMAGKGKNNIWGRRRKGGMWTPKAKPATRRYYQARLDEADEAFLLGQYYKHELIWYNLSRGKRARACMNAIRQAGLAGHSLPQILELLDGHYMSKHGHNPPAYSIPVDAIYQLECDEPPSGIPVTEKQIKEDLEARGGLIGDKMRANGVLELVVNLPPHNLCAERKKDYPEYGGFDVHDNAILDMGCDPAYSDIIKALAV